MGAVTPSKARIVGFGVFEVDLDARELRKRGVRVKLQEQPFQVLRILLERPGQVVTREELRQHIWPSDTFVDFDVGVNNAVRRLRDALGDSADNPRYIETIPKHGYRWIAPLNGHQSAVSLAPEPQKVRSTSRRVYFGAAGALAAVLIISIVYWAIVRMAPPAVPKILSLAVLELKSLSDDPRQAYFAEGITDAVITALAQIKALKVISHTTSIQVDRKKPLPEIARQLHVDGIVEGTVQRSGNRVRITVQLVHGPTDLHLWAESFEDELKDELVLERDIATKIANQIQVKVSPEEQAQLANVRPLNPRALDAYLDARFHLDRANSLELYKGKKTDRENEVRQALSSLETAIREDPKYVAAYIAFYDLIGAGSQTRLEFVPKAKTALMKVLGFEESNVAAHLAMARLLIQYEYDWTGAEAEYKRALQINPNSADAHTDYAGYLDDVGRNTQGDKERALAQALDPAHDRTFSCCGGNVNFRPEMSLDQKRAILTEKASDDPLLTGVLAKEYAIAGRYQDSVDLYVRCLTLYGWHDFVRVLKRANAKGGPKFALEEWMKAAEWYLEQNNDFPVFAMAFTYASLGDRDHAFMWLDKAVDQRNWCIIYLKSDNVWDPLRSDPRFKELLQRVGLPT
jgi:TolB-like protein/DNA-binding winged helix-turn-helix (wHTH) protein